MGHLRAGKVVIGAQVGDVVARVRLDIQHRFLPVGVVEALFDDDVELAVRIGIGSGLFEVGAQVLGAVALVVGLYRGDLLFLQIGKAVFARGAGVVHRQQDAAR